MATNGKSGNVLNQLEDLLELYLVKKVPGLPSNVKEILVKITPWANVVFIILGLLAIPVLLTVLGIGAALAPFAALGGASVVQAGVMGIAWAVIAVVTLVLEILAAKGLFAHAEKSWRYLYWAELLGFVGNVLSANLTSALIAVLFIYLLFQIKSYFNK